MHAAAIDHAVMANPLRIVTRRIALEGLVSQHDGRITSTKSVEEIICVPETCPFGALMDSMVNFLLFRDAELDSRRSTPDDTC